MTELRFDAVVIGGGAAGMAAALAIADRGFSVAIVEREDELGGILRQCIHNGFGLQEYGEELTGPEYALRYVAAVEASDVAVFLGTTVTAIEPSGAEKEIFCVSAEYGVMRILARAVVLAMGCRERNRGNIRIPGDRPAGVFTAGLAQRLVNREGFVPGKNVVIIGSGDIGLIMARRMKWIGCDVQAVIEIQPYPSGITRNIVQCLSDFRIPLYLSHVVTNIAGKERVEKVEVTPLENGAYDRSRSFEIPCDTLLLSVGLVPENELSKLAGVEIHPQTGGVVVDSTLMTSVDGIFAAGNVLHVHDLVDFVSEESRRAGAFVTEYLEGLRPETQLRVKAGSNVRYVAPGRVDPAREGRLYLRPLIVKNRAELEVRLGGRVVKKSVKPHVQPSEMITVTLGPENLAGAGPDDALEIAVT